MGLQKVVPWVLHPFIQACLGLSMPLRSCCRQSHPLSNCVNFKSAASIQLTHLICDSLLTDQML